MFIYFFSVRLCWFCVVICFTILATTANDLRLQKYFYPKCYPLHFNSIWIEKEPVIISLSVDKGTSGTIFITSLVWRGPWLGIEPGTSRTQSHHSTTRLSRRDLLQTISYTVSNSKKELFSHKTTWTSNVWKVIYGGMVVPISIIPIGYCHV